MSCLVKKSWFRFLLVAFLASTKVVAWSPPIDITVPGYTSDQAVAVDPSGKAMIVFIDSTDGLNPTVQASQLINGVPTTPHVFPLQSGGSNPLTPAVAVNANGNAVAVWVENNSNGLVIVAASFVNGSWEVPAIISDPSISVSTKAGVYLDDSNVATVVWLQYPLGGNNEIVARRRLLNSNWQTEEVLLSTTDYLFPPVLAGSSSGKCLAAWENIGLFLVGTAYFDGASWSVADIMGSDLWNFCGLNPISVSMNSASNAALLWQNNSGGLSSVRFIDGVFDTIQTISAINAYSPSIGIDGSNNAVAVWIEYNLNNTINVANLVNGSWSNKEILFSGSQEDVGLNLTQIAVQDSGDAVATWWLYLSSADTSEIVAAELTDGIWGTNTTVSLVAPTSFESLGMNSSGYAVIVWNNGIAPEIVLEAVIREQSSILPPTNLVGVQAKNKFFFQTEYLNTLSWQASVSPSVVHYNVFRDGKQIGVVLTTERLVFVDHNRKKSQHYTYTVTSVNASGVQSSGISIVL